MLLMKDLLLPLPLALHDWLIRTASNLLGFPAASKNTILYQRFHLSFLHRVRICWATKSPNHPAGAWNMLLEWLLKTRSEELRIKIFLLIKKNPSWQVICDECMFPGHSWGIHAVLNSLSWDQGRAAAVRSSARCQQAGSDWCVLSSLPLSSAWYLLLSKQAVRSTDLVWRCIAATGAAKSSYS